MNPSQIIKEAYDRIAAMKKAVGVDPKWLNRTLSHMDNAFASSKLIITAGSLSDTPEAKLTPSLQALCICPTGATDKNCPVHKS